jgi:membrane-associated protease RseP (regulator of RpoE activity)
MINDILFAIALLILFWDAIGLINRWFHLEKRGFSISPGFMMWRTKRGLSFIDRMAKFRRWWRAYGTVAVVVGFSLMVFVFVNLLLNLIYVLSRPAAAVPGVQLVLPGLVPGLTVVSWLVAVSTVLFVHELSHGFLLRSQGLQTKSVGLLLLVAIPGAFVEQNDKQMSRAPVLRQMRVFAAGAFSNVLFAILCLVILVLLIVPKPGAYVFAVAKGSPADNLHITPGMRIHSFNERIINQPADFESFMEQTRPHEKVRVVSSLGDSVVTLAENPENENRGFFGVFLASAASRWNFANPLFVLGTSVAELMGSTVFHPFLYEPLVPWEIFDMIKWMFVLNLGIGLFNLLPAVPLDGGYLLRGLLEKKMSKERANKVTKAISIFVLMLILTNFMPFLR